MSPAQDKLQGLLNNCEDINGLSAIVITEVQSGDVSVVELVELLGPWLTNTDKQQRLQGVRLLSDTISILPKDFLNEKECYILMAFFSDRLKDHYTLTPTTLAGLSSLTSMDNFPDDYTMELFVSLQQNVTCQALTVAARHSFYSILHNIFVKKRKKVLAEFPSDFLYCLISGMDSESDPRNLVYLFSFIPSIFSSIQLKHLADEAFTVLECYFPVDFNPVENKENITREDLAEGLERCFVSSPEFGPFCIQLVCEKIDSNLKIAQIDSLKLLISGVSTWNLDSVAEEIEKIWISLRNLLIPGLDPEVSILAIQALAAILTVFSTNVLDANKTKAFSYLLENIISNTHGYLADPGLTLFVPTVKLLSLLMSVSNSTAGYFIPRVIPQLTALLQSSRPVSDKCTVLKSLSLLLQSAIKSDSWENDDCRNDLGKSVSAIITLIENPLCRGNCFLCLSAVLTKVSEDIRYSLYELVKKTVATEPNDLTRIEYAKFISGCCEVFPNEVETHLLLNFAIPDDFDSVECQRLLELLTWAADAPSLTNVAGNIILGYITRKEDSRWKSDAIFVLRNYVCSKANTNVIRCLGTKCNYIMELVQCFRGVTSTNDDIPSVAQILSFIMRSLPSEDQTTVLQVNLDFINGIINAEVTPMNDVVLLEGLLCALRPSVQIENWKQLCESLVKFALTLDTEETRTSAARLFAVLINKGNNEEELLSVVKTVPGTLDKSTSPASIRLFAWLTKALVLRGHISAGDCLDRLIQVTLDKEFDMEGARGIQLVLEESSILSAENYCTVGLLYRQRVFEKIDLLIPQDNKPSKAASFAVSYILRNSPPSLVLGKIKKLIGVMVSCLDEGDPAISAAILQILSSLLRSDADITCLGETFIPRWLNLASKSPHMAVRQEALECIYLYANYKIEDITPFKKMVILRLKECLDDKKRLVRQAAVRARTRWFVV